MFNVPYKILFNKSNIGLRFFLQRFLLYLLNNSKFILIL